MACEENSLTEERHRGLRHWLVSGLALSLAAMLVRSSMFHVGNSYAFLSTIYSYDVLSPGLGVAAAAVVPYLELTIATALLFFPSARRAAFGWCAGLFLVFTAAQLLAYGRGLNIACGCFSPSADNPIGTMSIAVAFGCIVAATTGMALSSSTSRTEPSGESVTAPSLMHGPGGLQQR